MLEVQHCVVDDEIIDLQYDGKWKWGLEPLDNVSSMGKVERVLWPNRIQFKENATAPVFSFSTRSRMYLHLGGPSNSQIGYKPKNETNDLKGITLAMIPEKLNASAGGYGGYLGMLNATSDGDPDADTFAIEFDFVKSLEFSDQDVGDHFRININSMKSTVWAPLIPEAYSEVDAYLLNVLIEFNSSTQMLHVTIGNNNAHLPCPWHLKLYERARFRGTIEIQYKFLSHKVDLSVVLNENMYVGFTSSSRSGDSTSMFLDAWSLSTSSSGSSPLSASLPCSRPASRDWYSILFLLLMVVAGLAVTWSLLHGCYALRQWIERRRWRFHIDPDGLGATEVHKFTYKKLSQATRKFDKTQALGRGGFGSVYLGFLPGNREFVAVKRVAAESNHGEREFMAEVTTIGKIWHRNLVRLQGWCHKRGELLLVYDLMPNGSLDKLFFSPYTKFSASTRQCRIA